MIHPSGLRVLTAPLFPQSPLTLSSELTDSLLEVLRTQMAFTVIDLPPILTPSLEACLNASDIALHVMAPEVIAVQTAVQVNRSLTRSNITSAYKAHIINQVSAEAQLSQAAIERAINTRVAFQIGYDPNQPRALAQGVPLTLTAAKSALPTVVHRMADVIWQRVAKKETP